MPTYQCLIVDDEPIARDILLAYCRHLPLLEVAGASSNALEARQVLLRQKVHIMLLDINMPVLDGMAFLKTVKDPPQIIFTTAYREYAVDAFQLAACDYLLKPFSLERFIVAIDRAAERMKEPEPARKMEGSLPAADYFFIKADGRIYKIPFDEFLFAEAQGNYTRIVTTQNILLPTLTISGLEELLPKQLFPRVHRSFIIAKSRITHIEGNRVYIGKNEVPIGTHYKEGFMSLLGLQ